MFSVWIQRRFCSHLLRPLRRDSPLLNRTLKTCAVGRIADMFPDLLTSNPESDILPVLHFLSEEISISRSRYLASPED
ncbi:hypothetical protein DY000_02052192 [Brassica cretica]|uniref:Uncharacterized protein n=1 Tax=Brassica cretica TaxID=69181 RepID=A0ABQ7A8L4_BRACR|nr:hypothetical protein DY000_02052192 [Brassica cretica]